MRLTALPVASPRARPIGGNARVVLYTTAGSWRDSGVGLAAIASGLESHGFRPHVLATTESVASEFVSAGVPATAVLAGHGESLRLRHYLQSFNVQALIVEHGHDLRVATLAAIGSRVTVIDRFAGAPEQLTLDPVTRVGCASAVAGVVFPAESVRDAVLRQAPFMRRLEASTIHEGVDAQAFRPNVRRGAEFRREHGLGGADFLLGVGSLSAVNRHDLLIDALSLLGAAAPLLVLAGTGREEQGLRARAAARRVRVLFAGDLPQRDLVGAYNACTAMVDPGSGDATRLALREAMACGRPVIAAATGIVPELVGQDGHAGRLAALNSAWDMAAVIRRTLASPLEAHRMGLRARERAQHRFSLFAMERAYAQLVARHTGFHLGSAAV